MEIKRLARLAPFDEVLKEPVQTVAEGDIVALSAQVSYGTADGDQKLQSVPMAKGSGYLLTHFTSEARKVQKGDKIISIAGAEVALKVTEVNPCGYYSGPTLLQLVFIADDGGL